MSLINKMLQDLESRKNTQAETIPKKSVYEDLKPLSRIPATRASSRRLIILLAAVAVVGVGAYAWMLWGDGFVSGLFPDQAIAKSPPIVERRAAPKLTPPPMPAPVPVEAQAPPPASPVSTSNPAADTSGKIEQTQAAPTKSKAIGAAKTGYRTVSRGETLYGISAQTGIDLWRLSGWNGLGREHVIHPGQRLRLTPPPTPTSVKSQQAKTAAAMDSQAGHAVMDKKMKPLSSDEKAESEYRRAIDLLRKGRMADVEKHLKLALNANEAHTPARELLAGVMLQQGHWREAQQLLEQGIDKVPAHFPFAQLLARVYVEHGADQKALTIMEASRRAAADHPDYVAFLAALYQRAGKHAEAVKTYNQAVALNPQEARWWLGLGISLEALQDWNAADAAYQRAIDRGGLDDNLLKYARQRLAMLKNK